MKRCDKASDVFNEQFPLIKNRICLIKNEKFNQKDIKSSRK